VAIGAFGDCRHQIINAILDENMADVTCKYKKGELFVRPSAISNEYIF